jgi:hypothetical protein
MLARNPEQLLAATLSLTVAKSNQGHPLMATIWNVKSKSAEGSLDHILCDKPRQVFEALEDQRKMGREAWVEDAQGKTLDEMTFEPKLIDQK